MEWGMTRKKIEKEGVFARVYIHIFFTSVSKPMAAMADPSKQAEAAVNAFWKPGVKPTIELKVATPINL